MGTIKKRGERYQASVRITGHKPLYETFSTRKDARRWINDREDEIEARVVTSPDLLITELIERYEREIAPKRKMADSHLNHDIPSIKRSFNGMRMKDLDGRGLNDWVLKQRTTASTRNWHIARLYGVLRQAEAHWDIKVPWEAMSKARNRLFELGYLAMPKERDRRVSDAELTAIKSKLSPTLRIPAADIFDFCVASAMRIAEVCRITWEDLDEKARTVVIRDRKHPRKKFGNHQVVPLLNGSFEVIERQTTSKGRIFPWHPQAVSKLFHEAAVAAKVNDVVLHDLRHEGISRLFELGFGIEEVALVSGHTNWRTLRRYTHLKPASLVEKEKRLRGALMQVAG